MVKNGVIKIFEPGFILRKTQRLGEIPAAGAAYRKALAVAGPSVAEYCLVSLITLADTAMVSGEGTKAVAAVGLCNQPRFIVMALVLSLNIAVVSVTARRKGEKDRDSANACMKQALLLSLLLSVALSTLANIFSRQILSLAGAQYDTIDMGSAYFRILTFGIPASCLSLTISAAQRGIGKTRISMVINMVANVVNLVGNYLLIGGKFGFPRLGVHGAAIATVIGWYAGLLVALVSVLSEERYLNLLSRKGWRFERRTMSALWIVGSGTLLEQACTRVGLLAYSLVVANLGSTMFAIQVICMNIMHLSFSIGEGLGVASASLCGQNLGAKRPDLSQMYVGICQRLALMSGVMMFFVFSLGGRMLVSLFSSEEVVLEVGARILLIASLMVLGHSSQMVYVGTLRGAGDTRYVAMMSAITMLIVRPGFGWLLAYPVGLGIYGAWIAFFLDQCLRLAITYRRVRQGRWVGIQL